MRKVAISAEGKDLESKMDIHFGRAPYFIICDLETGACQALENPAALEARGAGIAAATFLVEQGVDAVITGHCGPKAFAVLKAAGIKVAHTAGSTIKEVLEKCKKGQVTYIEAPNVETHFGGGMLGLGKIMGGGRGQGCKSGGRRKGCSKKGAEAGRGHCCG